MHVSQTLLAPFQTKLDAILAAVQRVRESAAARHSEEMLGDLTTISNATAELARRVMRVAEGNPDDWSSSQIRHDLRTPLNHIIGYGEILLQEAEDVGATAVLTDLSRVVRAGKEILSDIDGLAKELSNPGRPVAPTPIAIPRSRIPSPSTHVAGSAKIVGRILVVDDNGANRELLTRLLRRSGHFVADAADGVEALDLLEAKRFDLVLLDLQMPRLDGTGVLSVMKQDSYLRHIPVIMISGLDELPKIVECIQLGADDYLSKPFDQVLLQARIGACLEKKQLRDRAVDHLEQIELEKRRANELLRVILPDAIVAELQATDTVKPRRYENVAVLFCDIVGFTAFSEGREPEEVLANLQKLVEAYEGLMSKHHMQKIKTIGDSFMAVAGLLDPVENPALQCARCGRDMIKLARQLPTDWGVRVGIAQGPVVAGVLGRQQYQFDLWGDTVNTASRVESMGAENCVSLSAGAWAHIENETGVRGRSLGSVPMKGKGLVPLYRLLEVDGEKIAAE